MKVDRTHLRIDFIQMFGDVLQCKAVHLNKCWPGGERCVKNLLDLFDIGLAAVWACFALSDDMHDSIIEVENALRGPSHKWREREVAGSGECGVNDRWRCNDVKTGAEDANKEDRIGGSTTVEAVLSLDTALF